MRPRLSPRARVLAALGSVMGARVLGRFLGALTAVLLARALGPGGFGQLAGALALVAFATPLLQGAIDSATLRALARPKGEGPAFLRAVLGAKLWLGLLATVALAVVGVPLSLPLVVAILALNAMASSLAGAVQTWWIAHDRQHPAALAEVARSVAWLGAAALVWWTGAGLVAAAWTRALASVVVTGAVLLAVRGRADWRPTLHGQGEVLRQSLVFFASGLFFIVYQQADRLMLLVMSGDAAAGHYAASANLVAVFYMVPGIFTTVLLPRMYRQAGDRARERRMLELRLGSGLLLAIAIVPLLIGFRHELLGMLYGAGYGAGAPVLAWLGGTILLRFAAVAYGDLLTAADRQGRRTAVQAGAALLNVGLNLLFIPRWQGAGAAAATLISESFLLAGYLLAVRRLGLPTRPRLLVPGTLACAGVTLAWLWQPWLGVASLAAVAGAAGYGVRRRLLASS